jgi:hypothetical protein
VRVCVCVCVCVRVCVRAWVCNVYNLWQTDRGLHLLRRHLDTAWSTRMSQLQIFYVHVRRVYVRVNLGLT